MIGCDGRQKKTLETGLQVASFILFFILMFLEWPADGDDVFEADSFLFHEMLAAPEKQEKKCIKQKRIMLFLVLVDAQSTNVKILSRLSLFRVVTAEKGKKCPIFITATPRGLWRGKATRDLTSFRLKAFFWSYFGQTNGSSATC